MMSANELKEQLKKAKLTNQVLMGITGVLLIGNIVFGVMMLQKNKKTEVYTPDESAAINDTLQQTDDLDNNLATYQFQQTVDSYQIVVDTLNRRLNRASQRINNFEVNRLPSNDYVGELIQYARQFNNSDCNKSLAFLYAAKKIAQTDGTSEANKNVLSEMIDSCEDNLFGNNTNQDTPSSSISAN